MCLHGTLRVAKMQKGAPCQRGKQRLRTHPPVYCKCYMADILVDQMLCSATTSLQSAVEISALIPGRKVQVSGATMYAILSVNG